MEINLPALRAEWLTNPLLQEIMRVCATMRTTRLTTLAWCQKHLSESRGRQAFNEFLLAFRVLEAAGLGRILQPTQRARARFQWAVLPVVILAALREREGKLKPSDILPEGREMGFTLPPAGPERAGWRRHTLSLRPEHQAELFLPLDLTQNEAKWLADYIQRLVAEPAREQKLEDQGQKPAEQERKPAERKRTPTE